MNHWEEAAASAAKELLHIAALQPGDTLVVGCSTSEVLGKHIGKAGSEEVAEAIVRGLLSVLRPAGVSLLAQCCEHLNRALVVEKAVAKAHGWEEVCVVPHPHAGGSFATAAYAALDAPVLVEEVKADAGLDIGQTFIGMHLKRVAVPVRLAQSTLGEATVNAARTRPKFIGGCRAKYE